MMDSKVFTSTLCIPSDSKNDHLYELLNSTTHEVTPKEAKDCCSDYPKFNPVTGKVFKSKVSKSTKKVKTVFHLKRQFEEYVLGYLKEDLEKRERFCLENIKSGDWKSIDNFRIIRQLLSCKDITLTKSTWLMLTNLNIYSREHKQQYVLYNGKEIRINGSRGGSKKYLLHCDVVNKQVRKVVRKPKLVQSSLHVKFKKGPLSKKSMLDESFQKFNIGLVQVKSLPNINLNVRPRYGTLLESHVVNKLNQIITIDDKITEVWANFSVSTLGQIVKDNFIQNEIPTVSFKLDYENKKNRLLLRDESVNYSESLEENKVRNQIDNSIAGLNDAINNVIKKLLDAVEVNLMQNELIKDDDEVSKIKIDDKCHNNSLNKELLNLKIDGISNENYEASIGKCELSFCKLGCVCKSLKNSIITQHCGQSSCIFKCYCTSNYLSNRIISNRLLLSRQKMIHEFDLNSSNESFSKYRTLKRQLNVTTVKLDCQNIEPFCMVHSLYKCFCKGLMTISNAEINSIGSPVIENNNGQKVSEEAKCASEECSETRLQEIQFYKKNHTNIVTPISLKDNSKTKNGETPLDFQNKNRLLTERSSLSPIEDDQLGLNNDNDNCSRIVPKFKRKHTASFYSDRNRKIVKMEENDNILRNRLNMRIKNSLNYNIRPDTPGNSSEGEKSRSVSPCSSAPITPFISSKANIDPKKFGSWLEKSYKIMKNKKTMNLGPPLLNKTCLFPWTELLKRYLNKKNFFLVSKTAPIRFIITVNKSDVFFNNFINIEDIDLQNISQYPKTIINLVKKIETKSSFVILFGKQHFWEVVGSVSKTNIGTENSSCNNSNKVANEPEKNDTLAYNGVKTRTYANDFIDDILKTEPEFPKDVASKSCYQTKSDEHLNKKNVVSQENIFSGKCTKWFLMTVENDFSELQFFKKGFFVTYEHILNTINYANNLGKTVKISCASNKDSDQIFGLYAIPNAKRNCLVIGPYEQDELLGFVTSKPNQYDSSAPRTRGKWIKSPSALMENFFDDIYTTNVQNECNAHARDKANYVEQESNMPTERFNQIEYPEKSAKIDSPSEISEPLECDIKSHKTKVVIDDNKKISNTKDSIETKTVVISKSKIVSPKSSKLTSKIVRGKFAHPIKIVHKEDIGKQKLVIINNKKKNIVSVEENVPREECKTETATTKKLFILKPSEINSNFMKPFSHKIPLDVGDHRDKFIIDKEMFILDNTFDEGNSSTNCKNIIFENNEYCADSKILKKHNMLSISINENNKLQGGKFDPELQNLVQNENIRVVCNENEGIVIISEDEVEESVNTVDKNLNITNELSKNVGDNTNKKDNIVKNIASEGEKINTNAESLSKDIFIECANVFNLGFITGNRNESGLISFKFPGFKKSQYYPSSIAFAKINAVIARKLLILDNRLLPVWRIIDTREDLTIKHPLTVEDLDKNNVLTLRGLKHRDLENIINCDQKSIKHIEKPNIEPPMI